MAAIRGNKKGKRSGRNASRKTYEKQLRRTTANKHRRAIKRDKQIKLFREHPELGSPSQRIARGIRLTCDLISGNIRSIADDRLRTWTVDPEALAESLARELEKVGAVITGKPSVKIIRKALPVNPDTIRDANWTL